MGTMINKFQKILGVLVMVVFFAEIPGFVSQAAETGETEKNTEVEVLEAKVIEDVEWNSEITPRTMLVD